MCLQSRKNLTANYVQSMQRWRSLSSVGQLKLKATHAHNLTHTIFRVQLDHTLSFTHIFVTALLHTIFHTQLCHTPSLSLKPLSHKTLSHTIFHTKLCHTSSSSHTICVTPSLSHLSHTHLCHTIFHTHIFVIPLSHTDTHTTWPHTIFRAQLDHTFCVASVALIGLGWVWWRAWGSLVARDAAALLRGPSPVP